MRFAVIVALLSLVGAVHAASLPTNNLYIQDNGLVDAGMSEQEFNAVLDGIHTAFAPTVALFGRTLVVERNWANGTVNAYASQQGTNWIISFFGGYARHPLINADGFAFVACHELGHHLGGYFFKRSTDRIAAEGQSDYYAAQVCLPYLWKGETVKNAEAHAMAPMSVQKMCELRYQEEAERHLCARVIVASYGNAKITGDIYRDPTPDYASRDTRVITTSDPQHPHGQCRLDTTMAAALCGKTYDLAVIPGLTEGNSVVAEQASFLMTCSEFHNDPVGARPKCWFKGLQ